MERSDEVSPLCDYQPDTLRQRRDTLEHRTAEGYVKRRDRIVCERSFVACRAAAFVSGFISTKMSRSIRIGISASASKLIVILSSCGVLCSSGDADSIRTHGRAFCAYARRR